MMIMDYADNGDLHKYLQNNFTNITWNEKLNILRRFSNGYLYFIISNTILLNINSYYF